MGKSSRKQRSCISDLPDEHLYLIFEKLESDLDKECFGLTCHRFLRIHDSSRKVLDLQQLLWLRNPNSRHIKYESFMLLSLLNRFRQLESLSLTGCEHVTDLGLVLLKEYGVKLRSIHLEFCSKITNLGFSFIAFGCPSLSVINLFSTNIGDSGLKILTKSCKSLKEVSVGWCHEITDSGIKSLTKNCRQLRTLRITGCKNIYGLGFKGCSSTLACLEADACRFSMGLTEVLSGGGLEYLNLAFLPMSVRGRGLAAIGSGVAANLKILNLWGCTYVDDYAIISISKGCPLLQEWSLISCEYITISGWESIGLHCQSLERIHVSSCLEFCDTGLLALGNGCSRLSTIYMKDCPLITPSGIQHFQILRTKVEIITEKPVVMSIIPSWAFEKTPIYRL